METIRQQGGSYVPPTTGPLTPIILTGIDLPFGDLVMLFVKMGLAAIPAAILLTIIGAVIFGLLTALVGGLGH